MPFSRIISAFFSVIFISTFAQSLSASVQWETVAKVERPAQFDYGFGLKVKNNEFFYATVENLPDINTIYVMRVDELGAPTVLTTVPNYAGYLNTVNVLLAGDAVVTYGAQSLASDEIKPFIKVGKNTADQNEWNTYYVPSTLGYAAAAEILADKVVIQTVSDIVGKEEIALWVFSLSDKTFEKIDSILVKEEEPLSGEVLISPNGDIYHTYKVKNKNGLMSAFVRKGQLKNAFETAYQSEYGGYMTVHTVVPQADQLTVFVHYQVAVETHYSTGVVHVKNGVASKVVELPFSISEPTVSRVVWASYVDSAREKVFLTGWFPLSTGVSWFTAQTNLDGSNFETIDYINEAALGTGLTASDDGYIYSMGAQKIDGIYYLLIRRMLE